eukprot:scaffold20841_cov23-Tisochrysis_lutea.AAC.2
MGAVEQLQQISRSLPPATLRSRLLLLEEGVRMGERASGVWGLRPGAVDVGWVGLKCEMTTHVRCPWNYATVTSDVSWGGCDVDWGVERGGIRALCETCKLGWTSTDVRVGSSRICDFMKRANAVTCINGGVEAYEHQQSTSGFSCRLRIDGCLIFLVCRQIEDRLEDVQPRTMVVAGGQDLVLPSAEEAANLKKAMPRAFPVVRACVCAHCMLSWFHGVPASALVPCMCARVQEPHKVLPSAGHAILSDPQVDLLQLMRKEGFLINKRVFTSPIRPGQREGFGLPGPVEMPTKQEDALVPGSNALAKAVFSGIPVCSLVQRSLPPLLVSLITQEVMRTGQDYTATLRRLLSPVFFSTLEDGTVVEGVEGLTPLMQQRERPLLMRLEREDLAVCGDVRRQKQMTEARGFRSKRLLLALAIKRGLRCE